MAATPDHKPLKILIAGAGIAGLATAISLSRIAAIPDLEIQLYEQAPELLEIGASIALSPNVRLTLTDIAMSVELIRLYRIGHAYSRETRRPQCPLRRDWLQRTKWNSSNLSVRLQPYILPSVSAFSQRVREGKGMELTASPKPLENEPGRLSRHPPQRP